LGELGLGVEVVVERDVPVANVARAFLPVFVSGQENQHRQECPCYVKGNGALGNSSVTGTYRELARSNAPGRRIHENS
jgi:hypothetical protein